MSHNSNWKRLRDGKLDWNLFHVRARILRLIRQFFTERDFLEIEPPLLVPFPALDANIHSVSVHLDVQGKHRTGFLHTSPEYAMKKLIAGGAERIVYLGKVFRDDELTLLHNPEFTMLEWYRTDADYDAIMKDTEELIRFLVHNLFGSDRFVYQNRSIDCSEGFNRITLNELFRSRCGIDLSENLKNESLTFAAIEKGITVTTEDDWESIFFKLFLTWIEPHLGVDKPVFVTDYPEKMALMARRKNSDPHSVERAELYIHGMELANGYSELTDPEEQERRFLAELENRSAGFNLSSIDRDFLDAMKSGLPPCAGMALGVDRLVMLLTDQTDIQNVLLFPANPLFAD